MLALETKQREECEYLIKMVDEIPDDRAPDTVKEVITVHTCRLADLDQPYAYTEEWKELDRERARKILDIVEDFQRAVRV